MGGERMSTVDVGLLEELLSALLGRAALLQRLIEIDRDPCWPRELSDTKARIQEVNAVLQGGAP